MLADLDLDRMFRDAPRLGVALTRLRDAIPAPQRYELFYGFFVHEDGLFRHDYICSVSRLGVALRLFALAGGPAQDPVARRARYWSAPRCYDLVRDCEQLGACTSPRRAFTGTLYRLGVRSVWVVPLNGADIAGYGVLNQLHMAADPVPNLPVHELVPFARRVHAAFRRNGVLLRELGLSADDSTLARQLAQGRSVAEMAACAGVAPRTIERRANTLRRRMSAKTNAEAIFKASAYGLL